jgi:hypothetical protein
MGKFPADAPEVTVVVQCPPLANYPKEVVQKSGNELAGLLKVDPKAAIPKLVADYKLLRDQCRAYQAK